MKLFIKIMAVSLLATAYIGSIMAADLLTESEAKAQTAIGSPHFLAPINPDIADNSHEDKAALWQFLNDQRKTLERQSQEINAQIVMLNRYLQRESERALEIKRLTEIVKAKDREIEEKKRHIESFTQNSRTWACDTTIFEQKPMGSTSLEIRMRDIIETQAQEIQGLRLALQQAYDCLSFLREPTVVTSPHAVSGSRRPPRYPTGGGTPHSLHYMPQ